MKNMLHSRMKNAESGMTLIELMIAMTVLAVGLAGIMGIVFAAMFANNHSRTDTSATWLAVMMIQQMGEIPASTNATFTITDCAGNTWNVNTAAGGAALRGTNNAPMWVKTDIDFSTTTNAGTVQADGTFSPTTPGDGYHMLYRACGTNGSNGILYDVRWFISNDIEQTKTVIVGAKIVGAASGQQNVYFSMPVQMKTILGT